MTMKLSENSVVPTKVPARIGESAQQHCAAACDHASHDCSFATDSRVGLLLASLCCAGPCTLSIYLPALEEIREAMKATEFQTQLTLSACFMGFTVANLIHGALSDSLGRK